MKSGNIKSFSVFGLFGTDDVHIPFDENVKILIGENGLGKTQVLNLFYYTLTRKFFKLSEFNFDRLELAFYNSEPIVITRNDVDELVSEVYNHPVIKDVIRAIGYSQFEILRNMLFQARSKFTARSVRKLEEDIESNPKFRKLQYPPRHIIRVLEQLDSDRTNNKSNLLFIDLGKTIELGINSTEVMYFPVYRRVEEDLHNLGYNNDDEFLDQEDALMKFGMNHIQSQFSSIEDEIDTFFKEGFTQFTTDILSVVLDDYKLNDLMLEKINQDDIERILSRVGNLIPQAQKESIKHIAATKEAKNPISAYLLQKLINMHEKQKERESDVEKFRDVCNKYLVDKKIFYDESAIKISIMSDRNSKDIALSKLSSGEKQIISMFSKIYLSDKDKRFIMLFDEPELSLSILWQKQLLPDIINSKKCDFLLAVTHSPFIFDNELDEFAIGLKEYFKPSMQEQFL